MDFVNRGRMPQQIEGHASQKRMVVRCFGWRFCCESRGKFCGDEAVHVSRGHFGSRVLDTALWPALAQRADSPPRRCRAMWQQPAGNPVAWQDQNLTPGTGSRVDVVRFSAWTEWSWLAANVNCFFWHGESLSHTILRSGGVFRFDPISFQSFASILGRFSGRGDGKMGYLGDPADK